MKKGCLFGCLVPIIILLLTFVVWTQQRHFYTVQDITFTVWKTWGGNAYITPYKYRRLFVRPRENYIRTSNLSLVRIYIGKDNKLYIFSDHFTEAMTLNTIEINLKKWNYELFTHTNELGSVDSWSLKRSYFRNSLKLPYLDMQIGSMIVRIGNYPAPVRRSETLRRTGDVLCSFEAVKNGVRTKVLPCPPY